MANIYKFKKSAYLCIIIISNSTSMKPSLKTISRSEERSFQVLKVNDTHFYPHWHFHPECEIMLIEKSKGIRYVGDNIDNFVEGDIFIFGPQLPHLLRNGDEYFKKQSGLRSQASVIYFSEDCWGREFLEMPEMKSIRELLLKSRRGIRVIGKSREYLKNEIQKIHHKEGMERVMHLLSVLHYISSSAQYELLAGTSFNSAGNKPDMERLNKVSDYLMKNFKKEITLEDVSEVALMSPTAFCRYFKQKTNKTLIEFVNEIRVGHACRLLMDAKVSVSEIAFDSGYNNVTNFNIQFKKIKKMAPLEYQYLYK